MCPQAQAQCKGALCLSQTLRFLEHHDDLQLGEVRPEVLPERGPLRWHLLLHHSRCLVPGGRGEDPHPAGPGEVPGRPAERGASGGGRGGRRCAGHGLGPHGGRLLCAGLVQVRWQ